MKRIFWIGVGATGTVLAARWIRRQRAKLSPANVGAQAADTVRDARLLLRESIEEGRRAAHEKEAELRGTYDVRR